MKMKKNTKDMNIMKENIITRINTMIKKGLIKRDHTLQIIIIKKDIIISMKEKINIIIIVIKNNILLHHLYPHHLVIKGDRDKRKVEGIMRILMILKKNMETDSIIIKEIIHLEDIFHQNILIEMKKKSLKNFMIRILKALPDKNLFENNQHKNTKANLHTKKIEIIEKDRNLMKGVKNHMMIKDNSKG